jgi:hypothetical protein
VLALLREKVSFVEASRLSSPKRLLLVEGSVRSKMVCHVKMLMMIDKEKQKNAAHMLLG